MDLSLVFVLACASLTSTFATVPRAETRPCDKCEKEIWHQLGPVYNPNRPFDMVRIRNPASFDDVMAGRTIHQHTQGSFRRFCRVMNSTSNLCAPECLREPMFNSSVTKAQHFCSHHYQVFEDLPTLRCLTEDVHARRSEICQTMDKLIRAYDMPEGYVPSKPKRNVTARDYRDYKQYCIHLMALIDCEHAVIMNSDARACLPLHKVHILRWRFDDIEDNVNQIQENLGRDSPRECVEILNKAEHYVGDAILGAQKVATTEAPTVPEVSSELADLLSNSSTVDSTNRTFVNIPVYPDLDSGVTAEGNATTLAGNFTASRTGGSSAEEEEVWAYVDKLLKSGKSSEIDYESAEITDAPIEIEPSPEPETEVPSITTTPAPKTPKIDSISQHPEESEVPTGNSTSSPPFASDSDPPAKGDPQSSAQTQKDTTGQGEGVNPFNSGGNTIIASGISTVNILCLTFVVILSHH